MNCSQQLWVRGYTPTEAHPAAGGIPCTAAVGRPLPPRSASAAPVQQSRPQSRRRPRWAQLTGTRPTAATSRHSWATSRHQPTPAEPPWTPESPSSASSSVYCYGRQPQVRLLGNGIRALAGTSFVLLQTVFHRHLHCTDSECLLFIHGNTFRSHV